PPHLKALLPFVAWADAQNGMYMRGGAVELGLSRHWSVINSIDTSLRRVRGSGDPRLIGGAVMKIAADLDAMPTSGYADLPVKGYSGRRGDDALNDLDKGIDLRNDAEYLDLASVTPGY